MAVELRKAVKWYKRAATVGNTAAQFYLAICYEFGKGTSIDKPEAVKWYKLAAEVGVSEAQIQLDRLRE